MIYNSKHKGHPMHPDKKGKGVSKNHARRKERFKKEMHMGDKEADCHAGVIDRLMRD